MLMPGCAHHRREVELREYGLTGRISAEPPAFLTGPASALLTNGSGYSAHLQADAPALGAASGASSGELLCRNDTLLFAPDEAQRPGKGSRPGGFTFIWNPLTASGYVLSESLQAYAPIQAKARATNILVRPSSGPPQTISGYTAQAHEATIQMSDGSAVQFQVFRSAELHEVPVRVASQTNASPIALTLSKVRLASPPAELFAPPGSFSKYASPETMADEIAARQRNLRRPARGEESPFTLPPDRR